MHDGDYEFHLVKSPMTVVENMSGLALVGLGSTGRRHLRLARELRPDIAMTVVRSSDESAWEALEGVEQVGSVAEVIDRDVAAAIVASPAPLHVEQAIAFVRRGIPVLIEKPLAHNMDAAKVLEATQAERSLILLGYMFRYDPGAQWFAEFLRSSRGGRLLRADIECGSYLPDWRPDQDYRHCVSASRTLGGGVLLELSHELDYANWFFGAVDRLQAMVTNTGTLDIDVEDMADLQLWTATGVPVSIRLDFCRRHPRRVCVAQMAEGELSWDVVGQEVQWRAASGEVETHDFTSDRDENYRRQLQHFFDCIENGSRPMVSLSDGIRCLELVDAAKRSSRLERMIQL